MVPKQTRYVKMCFVNGAWPKNEQNKNKKKKKRQIPREKIKVLINADVQNFTTFHSQH